jgi:hypothetical protein
VLRTDSGAHPTAITRSRGFAQHLEAASVPVCTVNFPGASVHAKQARGLYCRFLCCTGAVTRESLSGFGAWTEAQGGDAVYFLSAQSEQPWALTFTRKARKSPAAPKPKPKAAAKPTQPEAPRSTEPVGTTEAATPSKRRRGRASHGVRTAESAEAACDAVVEVARPLPRGAGRPKRPREAR